MQGQVFSTGEEKTVRKEKKIWRRRVGEGEGGGEEECAGRWGAEGSLEGEGGKVGGGGCQCCSLPVQDVCRAQKPVQLGALQ